MEGQVEANAVPGSAARGGAAASPPRTAGTTSYVPTMVSTSHPTIQYRIGWAKCVWCNKILHILCIIGWRDSIKRGECAGLLSNYSIDGQAMHMAFERTSKSTGADDLSTINVSSMLLSCKFLTGNRSTLGCSSICVADTNLVVIAASCKRKLAGEQDS